MSIFRPECDAAYFNERSRGALPGLLGVETLLLEQGHLHNRLVIRPELYAPNGYLHAGTVVTLADTGAGYACVAHLPAGASGFTTVELKSNHVGTAMDGTIEADVRAAHLGRTTQVWDATVTHVETGRTIALFRCTQLILWPR